MNIKGFTLLASMISVLLFIKFVVPFLEKKYKKYKIRQIQTVDKIKVQELEIK